MKSINDICNINIPNSLHSLLEASLLSDIEDSLNIGDEVVEFAQWLLNSVIYGFELTGAKCKTADKEDALSKMAMCVSSPSKGTYVIDTNKMFDTGMSENWDRLHITEKSLKELPKHVKTIKIYNFKYGQYQLSCYTHDISKINIEVYADEGRSYGDLQVVFWNKLKNKNVKLGKITCSNFRLGTYSSKIESVSKYANTLKGMPRGYKDAETKSPFVQFISTHKEGIILLDELTICSHSSRLIDLPFLWGFILASNNTSLA